MLVSTPEYTENTVFKTKIKIFTKLKHEEVTVLCPVTRICLVSIQSTQTKTNLYVNTDCDVSKRKHFTWLKLPTSKATWL